MRARRLAIPGLCILIAAAVLGSCGDDSGAVVPPEVSAFRFLVANNPALTTDATATFALTDIRVIVPAGTNVSALVATFETTGTTVQVGTTAQVSGVTANDFTNPVLYHVTGVDGTVRDFTVTVFTSESGAKDLTSFAFLDAANPALMTNVTATITGKMIVATVPPGTDVTALVATFATTGTGVSVGSVAQVSGATPNDFSNPVSYVVTAPDTTTKTYTVTVRTTADLISFKLLAASNPALTADVTAMIDGTEVTAFLPMGTDVTALVATFTTTGANVKVGTTTQVSGTTPNDFTDPVAYVVTGADSATQTYTVTLTVPPPVP